MSDVDRDEVEISAIAAMTTAEVRAALRQFGLQPFESLPPELSCLRAPGESHPDTTTKPLKQSEEIQSILTVTPGGEAARKYSMRMPVWAVVRWQFQWFKNGWRTVAFRRVLVVLVFVTLLASIVLERRATANYPEQPTTAVVPSSVYSKTEIIGFTGSTDGKENDELLIRKSMASLFTSRCTEAFANAGLRTPLEVATHEGMVILPARDLYKYSAERLGLASEATRHAYRDAFSSYRAQSGTIRPTLNGVRLTTDGRARVLLHDTAFLGESVIFARLSLTNVLTHEFIHVGGQPPTPDWFFQHDLKGFEHYDEIMGACR